MINQCSFYASGKERRRRSRADRDRDRRDASLSRGGEIAPVIGVAPLLAALSAMLARLGSAERRRFDDGEIGSTAIHSDPIVSSSPSRQDRFLSDARFGTVHSLVEIRR
jgi:beta-phosphoglucomutase-like phosphatase (HAD superfamily)